MTTSSTRRCEVSSKDEALALRGWNREVNNHRTNLSKALDDLARNVEQARADLNAGNVNTQALRQMVTDTAEAYRRAASLEALAQVSFLLPDADSTARDAEGN